MKDLSYFEERDLKNRAKIEDILSAIPSFCYDYQISMESRGLSSLSRLNYLIDIKIFFEFLADYLGKEIKSISLEELGGLKPIDFQTFLSEQAKGRVIVSDGKKRLLKSGVKAQARKLSAIKSLYKYLFNNDLISSNVTTKVETPKIADDNHKIRRLYSDEIQPMLTSTKYNDLQNHHKYF